VLLQIEPQSDEPIYLQLRNQIVQALVRGELKEGDALPSVRRLAVDLGINLHTVNKAYQLLESQGYLHIYRRRGARITAPLAPTGDYVDQLASDLKKLYIEAQSHGVDRRMFEQTVKTMLAKEAENAH